MTTVPITEARTELSALFDRVAFDHDRIIIDRHGRDRIAMVPIEDLDRLQAIEDRADIEAADAALAESAERIAYEDIKKDLGL